MDLIDQQHDTLVDKRRQYIDKHSHYCTYINSGCWGWIPYQLEPICVLSTAQLNPNILYKDLVLSCILQVKYFNTCCLIQI